MRYLPALKVTFELLIKAGNIDAHNVQCGCWNKRVVTAYVCTCRVTTSVRDNLWIICCKNDNKMDVEDDNNHDGDNEEEIGDKYAR